ncbi:uncharacterized protein METZ01_LOCUS474807, partial [marine metagenome]
LTSQPVKKCGENEALLALIYCLPMMSSFSLTKMASLPSPLCLPTESRYMHEQRSWKKTPGHHPVSLAQHCMCATGTKSWRWTSVN